MSTGMMLILPLCITLVVETGVACVWGHNKPSELGILALINIITNLSLNAVLLVLRLYLPAQKINICIYLAEVIIWLAEACLIRRFLERCRHPFWLSLTANAASYFAGLMVFKVMGY